MNVERINLYIQDSLISNKICRFNKQYIYIFMSKISAPISDAQKNNYYSIVEKAVEIWNKVAPVNYLFTDSPVNADVTIIWSKVGIKFEGMCKFKSIVASEFRSVTIEIGLPNQYSPKKIDDNTILHTALHELGHSLGLGHGICEDDVMFVPHRKTLLKPSKNDISVLNILYSNPIGTLYENLIK